MQIFLPKSVSPETNFGSKTSPGGPVLAIFFAKFGLARPSLGGTDFGVTVQYGGQIYGSENMIVYAFPKFPYIQYATHPLLIG